jgi:hypothetical protein
MPGNRRFFGAIRKLSDRAKPVLKALPGIDAGKPKVFRRNTGSLPIQTAIFWWSSWLYVGVVA